MKKWTSLILAFLLIVSIAPTAVLAATDIVAECNIADGATNVTNPNMNECVTVTFNQEMDKATLTTTNVKLRGNMYGSNQIAFTDVDTVTNKTTDDTGRSISFDMRQLNSNTTYEVVVTTAVKNKTGTAYPAEEVICSFTTGDIKVCEVTEGAKLVNAALGKTVTGTTANDKVTDGTSVNYAQSANSDDRGFTIDLEDPYTPKAVDIVANVGVWGVGYANFTIYGHNDANATVDNGMTELGATLTGNMWNTPAVTGMTSYRVFLDNTSEYRYITLKNTGGFYIYECGVLVEYIEEPIEVSCNIEDGDTDVTNPNMNECVTVTFNQPMDPSTLTTSHIVLTGTTFGGNLVVPFTSLSPVTHRSTDEENLSISFDMKQLNSYTNYTVSVKDTVKNAAGTSYSGEEVLCSFKTGEINVIPKEEGKTFKNVALSKPATGATTGNNNVVLTDGTVTNSSASYATTVDKYITIDLEDSYGIKVLDLMAQPSVWGNGYSNFTIYGHNEADAEIGGADMTKIGQTPTGWWSSVPHASGLGLYRIFLDNEENFRYITLSNTGNFNLYEVGVYASVFETERHFKVSQCSENYSQATSGTNPVQIVQNGREMVTLSNSTKDYLVWDVDIHNAGTYALSFMAAYSTKAYDATVAAFVDTGDGDGFVSVAEKAVVLGRDMTIYNENPICAMHFEAGTIRVKLLQTYADIYLSDLVVKNYDSFEIQEVKAGTTIIEDGDTIPRGTDSFTVTFNNKVNVETANNLKITDGENVIPAEYAVNDNVVDIQLRKTLDYNTSYTLETDGVKDSYNVYTLTGAFASYQTVEDSLTDSGSASFKDVKGDIDGLAITIEGNVLSSKNIGIAGRNVEVYIEDTFGVLAPEAVESTLTTNDGKFTMNFDLPSSYRELSGKYTFVIKTDYAEQKEVELVYVSEEMEIEILSAIADTTTTTEVETAINAYAQYLGISLSDDIENLPDTSEAKNRFLTHFVSKSYTGVNAFILDYYTNIAFETLNQATEVATIELVLNNETDSNYLGIDKIKTDQIVTERDEFLTEILEIETKDTLEDYMYEFDRIMYRYLNEVLSIPAPTLVLDNESVYAGEGIPVKLSFTDNTINASKFVFEISSPENSAFISGVSTSLLIDATTTTKVEGDKLTVTITPDNRLDNVKDLGYIYLSAGNTLGTYNYTIEGFVTHRTFTDVGEEKIWIETTSFITPVTVEVVVSKAPGNTPSRTETSSPGTGLGGRKPIEEEPSEKPENPDTEPDIGENTTEKYEFSDLGGSEWAKESIEYLVDKGVIARTEAKKFYPSNQVKREEFVKMIVLAFDLWDKTEECDDFEDVTIDDWHYSYVASAKKHGVILGNGFGSFGEGSSLTREDMCVILNRLMSKVKPELTDDEPYEPFADDINISDYAKDAVYSMKKQNVINGVGDNRFEPKSSVTRAMAAKVIYELLILGDKAN